MIIRAVSFNCHKLKRFFSREYFLEDLRSFFEQMEADIVFLQELRGLHPEKHKNQYLLHPLEFLADNLWPHYAYGRNAVYSSGHHGNAILSRYEIISNENLDISNHPLEKRGLLSARIQLPDHYGTLGVANVHLDLSAWGRKKQMKKIMEHLSGVGNDMPYVLAGDFNDWNNQLSQYMITMGFEDCHLATQKKLAKTFPSFIPLAPLDRIYSRNLQIQEAYVCQAAHWKKLSDHRPLHARWLVSLPKAD